MRTVSGLLVVSGLAVACAGTEQVAPHRLPPPPPQTYVLFGIVKDEAGLALPFAEARLVNLNRVSSSNDSGFFSFTEVRGDVTLRLVKPGYTFVVQKFFINADLAVQARLDRLPGGDTLVLGATMGAEVESRAPPCDPIQWDAMAPCRRFTFKAPMGGRLRVEVAWPSDPELDVTMVGANNGYVGTSKRDGIRLEVLQAAVQAGATYEVRVNSYYGGQVFTLKAQYQ